MKRDEGFTLIEILVVITIVAVLAGLVVALVGTSTRMSLQVQCVNNVRNLTGLLEEASPSRYPAHGGPNQLLYLVTKGKLAGKDLLETLFCPGDLQESLDQCGGVAAYADLDLTQQNGHLTSYAARAADQPARKGAIPAMVLVADDSSDHHDDRGVVVGLTGGVARFRDRMDDYGLAKDAPLLVGEGSAAEELRALRAE